MITIGILGIHGSREEHAEKMQQLGCKTIFLRNKKDFENIDGIILPGGESTAFKLLLEKTGIENILKEYIIEKKIPTFGTCAGSILLSSSATKNNLNILDIEIDRNAYGRQIDSFSDEIKIEGLKNQFHAIFIRAPQIASVGTNIKILAEYKNKPVLVQSENILAATFHPELTNDLRVHEIFLEMIQL